MSYLDKIDSSCKDIELSFAVLSLEIFRTHNEVTKWIENCEEGANESNLSALDVFVLSIICNCNLPKSTNIISTTLNKNDDLCVNYSLKKLTKIGLIKKIPSPVLTNKNTYYCATEDGWNHRNHYSNLRKQVISKVINSKKLENISKIIDLLREARSLYRSLAEAIFDNNYEFK